jgi:hypothetical protein
MHASAFVASWNVEHRVPADPPELQLKNWRLLLTGTHNEAGEPPNVFWMSSIGQ